MVSTQSNVSWACVTVMTVRDPTFHVHPVYYVGNGMDPIRERI